MEFALSEDLQDLQRAVRAFAQRELAPHAAELDRHPRFPWPTLRKMGEMGLLGVMTPEEHGGSASVSSRSPCSSRRSRPRTRRTR